MEQLFVAISFDTNQLFQKIQHTVVQKIESILIPYNAAIKAQEHLHLTLYFIGRYANEELATITQHCDAAVKHYLESNGAGSLATYSSGLGLEMLGDHGVIALMLELSKPLEQLYQAFVHIFEKNNSKNTIRSLLPHITIARLKRIHRKDLQKIKIPISTELHEIAKTLKPIQLPIYELMLFSSQQGLYRVIKKYAI